jgi:hypothetical protein
MKVKRWEQEVKNREERASVKKEVMDLGGVYNQRVSKEGRK